MKVLVIGHAYITPINRDKWKALVKQDERITLDIIVPVKWPGALFNHEVMAGIIEEGVRYRVHALPVYCAGNEVRYHYHWRTFFTLLKKISPEIIHIEQGITALSYVQAILCAKLLRLKASFVFFTWINWSAQRRITDFLWWDWVVRFNSFYTGGAFAGNSKARELLLPVLGRKPIAVLPQLGVSQQIFNPALRAQYHNTSVKRILFVGRFVPEKGIFLLLEAFSLVSSYYPDWELVFMGKGPEEHALVATRDSLGLSHAVSICPVIPHDALAQEYAQAEIVVLPSYDTPTWREQFGHVLIEAMASGVCVVGSSAGEIPYVIAHAGVVFEQNNLADLTQKLTKLMASDTLRAQYAAAGYARVMSEYTQEAIAQKSICFWRQLRGYADCVD